MQSRVDVTWATSHEGAGHWSGGAPACGRHSKTSHARRHRRLERATEIPAAGGIRSDDQMTRWLSRQHRSDRAGRAAKRLEGAPCLRLLEQRPEKHGVALVALNWIGKLVHQGRPLVRPFLLGPAPRHDAMKALTVSFTRQDPVWIDICVCGKRVVSGVLICFRCWIRSGRGRSWLAWQ